MMASVLDQIGELRRQATRPGSIARSFLAGSGLTLAARLVNGLALVLINMILARSLSVSDFGQYALAYSISITVGIVAALGLVTGAFQLVGEAAARGDRPRLFGAVQTISRTVTATSIVVIVLFVGIGFVHSESLAVASPLAGFCIGVWAASTAWRGAITSALRALGDHRNGSLYDGAVAAVLMLLGLLVAWLLGSLDLTTALILGALSSALSAVPCRRALVRLLGPRPPHMVPVEIPALLRLGLPLLLIGVVGQLSFQLPLWLLSAIGSPTDAALYAVASQIFVIINLVCAVTMIAANPVIVRLHAQGQTTRLGRFVRGAAVATALPVLAGVLVLAMIGGDLVALMFGEAYRASGDIALVLCLGLLAHSLCGLNVPLLSMTGAQLMASFVVLLANLTLLPLAWVGYMQGGVLGTAVATAVMFALPNAVLALLVRRRMGFLSLASIR